VDDLEPRDVDVVVAPRWRGSTGGRVSEQLRPPAQHVVGERRAASDAGRAGPRRAEVREGEVGPTEARQRGLEVAGTLAMTRESDGARVASR